MESVDQDFRWSRFQLLDQYVRIVSNDMSMDLRSGYQKYFPLPMVSTSLKTYKVSQKHLIFTLHIWHTCVNTTYLLRVFVMAYLIGFCV